MAEVTENRNWGGVREGAGRPKGSKGAVQRGQHQLRATDEEWTMIKEFAAVLKKDPERAKRMLMCQ